ncbi:AAEL003511-PA [Aedes aegypti]|uniref:AAEL003511-PA n=1 Tax=Aedes aegypti TaxID=7159 RepID=Q0IG36_AEDAE|nr:AAEL003511-PA [Aedes aegypti]
MMSSGAFILSVVLSVSISVLQTSSLQHSATLKSFNEILSECSRYLPSNDEPCYDRCLGLVGRFWNDTIARPSVSVGRFYRPDPCDQNYVNRTQQCICDSVLPLPRKDVCLRASRGLQCYRNQYGRLIADEPLFVSVTPLQSSQIFQDCAQMLQIPRAKLEEIVQQGYSKSPEGSCLVRCYLVRAGLYSDSQGPDIARFAVQCEGYEDAYEASVARCYQKLKSEQLDKCTLAARTYDECIQANEYSNSNLEILGVLLGIITGLIPA